MLSRMNNLPTVARVATAVIIVSAVVIIATSGESIAVRYLTGLVAADVSVRLIMHAGATGRSRP
ncbi:MAG: hypothetical protein ACRD12_10905 [Acidimicrobiales bacterium]